MDIKLFQLNMHKSKACMAGFSNWTSDKEEAFIYCVQEPCVHKSNVIGVPKGLSVNHHASNNRTRAAVISSRGLNAWSMPEFTNEDISTVLFKGILAESDDDKEDLIVCSVYLDITDSKVIPDQLEKLVQMAKRYHKKLVVCLDTNAHSILLGKDTNSRGEKLEEFIFCYDLKIENRGQ